MEIFPSVVLAIGVLAIGVLIALLCYFLVYDKAPTPRMIDNGSGPPIIDIITIKERDRMQYNGKIGMIIGGGYCIRRFVQYISGYIRAINKTSKTSRTDSEATGPKHRSRASPNRRNKLSGISVYSIIFFNPVSIQ